MFAQLYFKDAADEKSPDHAHGDSLLLQFNQVHIAALSRAASQGRA